MDFNKNDIEFYLLTKEYDALTKDELAIVSQAVASKEEYQSLKQLLLVMEEASTEVELIPASNIKEELVATFEKARWGADVGVDNQPEIISLIEESNKKRGKLFWLSIAASLTLLIGLFLNRETLFMPKENQLVLVKTQNNKMELEEIITKEQTVLETELEDRVEDELIETIIANEVEGLSQKNTEEVDFNNEMEDENELVGEEIIEYPNFSEVSAGAFNTKDNIQLTKADSESESSVFINSDKKEVSLSSVTIQSDKKVFLANESVSLKEDKDLISLLYTAL